jgi:hypothetical protein
MLRVLSGMCAADIVCEGENGPLEAGVACASTHADGHHSRGALLLQLLVLLLLLRLAGHLLAGSSEDACSRRHCDGVCLL